MDSRPGVGVHSEEIAIKGNNIMYVKQNTSPSGGIGFVGLLTILFIGLKLTGYITWSWLLVLSPIWISILLFLAFAILVILLSD